MKKMTALLLAALMVLSMAACASKPAETAESDLAYIQDKGTLVVGITDFAPMDYQNESGEWVGFDADLAKAFAESLGVKVEFVEIVWDNKVLELDSKTIDCVWNGMTLTGEVTESMSCSNAYCNNTQVVVVPADTAADYQSADACKSLNFAVEAGSAGEAAAAEKGFKTVSVDTQAKALMEVDAGTADAAIIDLLMAGAMVGENTSYPNLKVTDQKLTSELYGIGCRKGSDLASFINSVLAETYASGKMQEVATTYGVQESLVEQSPCEYTASESDSDVQYIKDKGKLIVGITEFEPMDYQDANGQWIGFDADMAKLVAEKLGVEVEFQVINWDTKVEELDGKTIDCVWNGMTLTDAVMNAMECSNAYCNNAQVVITK